MRNEEQIKEVLAEMQRMAEKARKAIELEITKDSPFLTQQFTKWMHRCDARVSILEWVLGGEVDLENK